MGEWRTARLARHGCFPLLAARSIPFLATMIKYVPIRLHFICTVALHLRSPKLQAPRRLLNFEASMIFWSRKLTLLLASFLLLHPPSLPQLSLASPSGASTPTSPSMSMLWSSLVKTMLFPRYGKRCRGHADPIYVGGVSCDNKPQYQEGWWLAPTSPAGDKVYGGSVFEGGKRGKRASFTKEPPRASSEGDNGGTSSPEQLRSSK